MRTVKGGFVCNDCGNWFRASPEEKKPACPKCKSLDLKRIIDTAAIPD